MEGCPEGTLIDGWQVGEFIISYARRYLIRGHRQQISRLRSTCFSNFRCVTAHDHRQQIPGFDIGPTEPLAA